MALLLAALFVEVGFALLVAPWTNYWDRNYFVEWLPGWRELLSSTYVRGAVSGLGVVNIGAGVGELIHLFAARSSQAPVGVRIAPSTPPE
jgi:hypothetical protein